MLSSDTGKEMNAKKIMRKPRFEVVVLISFFMFIFIVGITYRMLLVPSKETINKTIDYFSANSYRIPIVVAEKYLVFERMRDFYYGLYYGFSCLSILASMIVISFASTYTRRRSDDQEYQYENDSVVNEEANTHKRKEGDDGKNIMLVTFSLLAMILTVLNILINPKLIADTSQQCWHKIESAILTVSYDPSINDTERDNSLINVVIEAEDLFSLKIY